MHYITIRKKRHAIPSKWTEVTFVHLQAVAPFLFGAPQTEALRKTMVLFALVPSAKKYWLHNKLANQLVNRWPWLQHIFPALTDAQKWDLLQPVNWLFEDFTGRSIVREFKHKGIRYLLPEDNLVKESMIAYSFADSYFSQYLQSKDPAYLDLVIACIARQPGSASYPALQHSEGDPREHFSTSRTQERAHAFKTLDVAIKNAILIYFMGSKRFIHKQYEVMFKAKKEVKAEPVDDTAAKRANFGKKKIPKPDYGWIGVLYELAEQKTFGNFDQVKHQFLHTCCYYLTKKRYEQEEQTA